MNSNIYGNGCSYANISIRNILTNEGLAKKEYWDLSYDVY